MASIDCIFHRFAASESDHKRATDKGNREQWCNTPGITLDGKPARISGKATPFATVYQVDNPAFGIDFAWATVGRIVSAGGKFRS